MNYVVDTNVPVVANGRNVHGEASPSTKCRLAALAFLELLLEHGRIHVDDEGRIQAEYHRHLNPRGQPGVGDRFYQAVLNSAPAKIVRVSMEMDAEGGYADFPSVPELANFDPNDRKFVAVALRQGVPVANAVDSDWLNHRVYLEGQGLKIKFVCGTAPQKWFETAEHPG